MKVRHGFVSNSSSSSFVISKEAYPTIWDLALHMLRIRDADYHQEDLRHKLYQQEIHPLISDAQLRVLERRNSGEQAEALTFPSCNFDTYIWDAGDTFWVSTCNNHPFYAELRGQVSESETPIPMGDYGLMDYIEFQLEHDHDWEKV